ncbi:MAG: crossover junction endodeoxyribonuclease RuvC [Acinetobacter sp.]|nr:crossover junction endodeoxyribonuclease RuvC [Acinetobacter sp.]
MKILALDPATITGWAVYTGETPPIVSGIINISLRKGESVGIKWLRFEKWLKITIQKYGITVVSAERVSGRGPDAIVHHAKLLGVIEKVCVEQEIEHLQYSATEIKKFATGKGNADKQDMIRAARARYDWSGEDHNEADALHILMLTLTKI